MANLINLNNTTPAAPGNGQNALWQSDASSPTNVSAYIALNSIAKQILSNQSGSLYGDGNFTYDPATGIVTLSGSVTGSFTISNPTAATGGANQTSPLVTLKGTYWTGSASAVDSWTIQDVLGTGSNPTSVLTFTHAGSGGGISVSIPYPLFLNAVTCTSLASQGQVNIAQAGFGSNLEIGQSEELLTLSTISTHTDTAGNLLPANSIIDSVAIYITQTISGGSTPTTIAVGDASTSNRFISTGTPLTAGSSAVGLNQIDAGTSSQASNAKVRITLDQLPGQGIVRIVTFWRNFTAPTS